MIEPPCVSELTIDRLLADELARDVADAVRAHATSCASCGPLLADAERVAREFAADPPVLRLPAARRRTSWALGAGGALLAAAAALAIFVRTRPVEPEISPSVSGIRTKGSAVLGFFVSHAGELRRGQSGEVVAPADRVQLVTTTEQAGWIAVTGTDARGVRTVYGAPQPLDAGRDRELPFSIILDDTLGRSTISAVFCPSPFTLDAPPASCTTDTIAIDTRR
jgi:hypothetical protein